MNDKKIDKEIIFALEKLCDHVRDTLWLYEYYLGKESIYCRECGWSADTDAKEFVMGRAVLAHHENCELVESLIIVSRFIEEK